MTRALVTGGTGFVAAWCIAELVEAGYEVVATVRAPGSAEEVRSAVETQVGADAPVSFAVADLVGDDGWDDAMAGCDHVLHVASPLSAEGEDPASMITAACDGTLRVLAAADRAGVQRIVVTSSCAAATPPASQLTGTVDETCWTDADEAGLNPYRRSKVLAERAAWAAAEERGLELVTVLPAAVFGPALAKRSLGSLQLIAALLDGSALAIPRLGLEVVDVRDVAKAHVLALTTPAAAGQRFIVSGEVLWFGDVAEVLRTHLGPDGAKVPTATLTDDDFRAFAATSPALESLLPLLGRELQHSPAKAERVLGWERRPTTDTIVDSARCLLSFAADG